ADREPKQKKNSVVLEAPLASPTPLTLVQQDVVQALVAQGLKQQDAFARTRAAGEGNFDTLFRAAVSGSTPDGTMPQPHRSPIDEESRGHESTPDLSQAGDSDENEESQPETESAESD